MTGPRPSLLPPPASSAAPPHGGGARRIWSHRLVRLQHSRCNVSACPQVAAGSVQKAVIVETKKEFQRPDGSTLRFDRNACVLVNAKGMPIGSRVLGFVTHELRARNLMKARARWSCPVEPSILLVWGSLTKFSSFCINNKVYK